MLQHIIIPTSQKNENKNSALFLSMKTTEYSILCLGSITRFPMHPVKASICQEFFLPYPLNSYFFCVYNF